MNILNHVPIACPTRWLALFFADKVPHTLRNFIGSNSRSLIRHFTHVIRLHSTIFTFSVEGSEYSIRFDPTALIIGDDAIDNIQNNVRLASLTPYLGPLFLPHSFTNFIGSY